MSQRTDREIALDKAEEFIREYHKEKRSYQFLIEGKQLALPFCKSTLADLLMEFLDEVSEVS